MGKYLGDSEKHRLVKGAIVYEATEELNKPNVAHEFRYQNWNLRDSRFAKDLL